MSRAARALIDLSALRHNLRQARSHAPDSRVLAVIKADGYGHGLLRVGRALDEADGYAVARLEEAMALRQALPGRTIVALEGFEDTDELRQLSAAGIESVVHHPEQLDMLERERLRQPLPVWLKIDTGMHRLGFPPAAAADAWRRLRQCPSVHGRIRLMTHLANADDLADPRSREQLERFDRATAGMDGERSAANSAGLMGWPDSRLDWNRPGIMLYGVSPFLEGRGVAQGLKPVMTLTSRLIAVTRLARGDAVGYGGTWRAPRDMPLGVVAIGYGDGYPRHARNGTPLLVNGRRCALVGRVSMDMICVDLSAQPDARIGDPVVLWGEGLPVEEIAEHAGTIPYELLCNVSRRVRIEERS